MYKHNRKIFILLVILLITNEAKTSTDSWTCDMEYKNYYRSQTYQPSYECLYKRKKTLREPSSQVLNTTIMCWGVVLAIGIATVVIAAPQSR